MKKKMMLSGAIGALLIGISVPAISACVTDNIPTAVVASAESITETAPADAPAPPPVQHRHKLAVAHHHAVGHKSPVAHHARPAQVAVLPEEPTAYVEPIADLPPLPAYHEDAPVAQLQTPMSDEDGAAQADEMDVQTDTQSDTPAPAATPVAPAVNVSSVVPFSPEANFMSPAGYLRYQTYAMTGNWMTREQAVAQVNDEMQSATR